MSQPSRLFFSPAGYENRHMDPDPARSFSTVALIVVLFQGIYCNPPICIRHTNQPGPAGPIRLYLAPDAIRNPPHENGLSQAAPPASGVRGLSGGIWALARITPAPTAPCFGLHWRPFILMEQDTDMPPVHDPKSLQLSPRSDSIALSN